MKPSTFGECVSCGITLTAPGPGRCRGCLDQRLRVLVTGSRTWTNREAVRSVMSGIMAQWTRLAPSQVTIIHGDGLGADQIVAAEAELRGYQLEAHPADWKRYGKAAGPRRNAEMVASGFNVAFAFWDGASRGTLDCIRRIVAAGFSVKLIADRSRRSAK